jgi:hypothetical protein
MCTLAFIILSIFLRVFLVVLVKLYLIITLNSCGGRKLYKILRKDLFYNYILILTIESLLEFQISGYLNLLGLI